MTDTAPAQTRATRIGPGRLVLVVGPSGAGKDTLIDRARAACAGDETIVFARRVVTRPASAAEDNDHISGDAFRQALARGDFIAHWEAHGLHYALPRRIDEQVRDGRTIVANVSRTIVSALRAAYADVVVVLVTAPADVLAARLLARGRASDGPIAGRLGRQVETIDADVTIHNTGSADDHARELVGAIRRR